MGYYLLDNPSPGYPQYANPRRAGQKPTGTIIVHTAENAMDLSGPDDSAENCANFIRFRNDYGSYHRLVDYDSIIKMVPFSYEAWQDSETNGWGIGISAAVQAARWLDIPAARRDKIYRNLAKAGAEAVRYMKSEHGITVPIKRITGAQARAKKPGFAAHGDSGISRSDPGQSFDWNLFFKYVNEELGNKTAAKVSSAKQKVTKPKAKKEKILWRMDRGDNLAKIVAYYNGPTAAQIIKTNPFMNAWTVPLGTIVTIPGKLYWRVDPGDSWTKIANYYAVSVAHVKAMNPKIKTLHPGQMLRIQ